MRITFDPAKSARNVAERGLAFERAGDMSTVTDDAASRPDDENPEWTEEQVRQARPLSELFKELFGADGPDRLRRGRGRPEKEGKKISPTLRLDPDVLEAYRLEGDGWQTRMNEVLRAHMPKPRR